MIRLTNKTVLHSLTKPGSTSVNHVALLYMFFWGLWLVPPSVISITGLWCCWMQGFENPLTDWRSLSLWGSCLRALHSEVRCSLWTRWCHPPASSANEEQTVSRMQSSRDMSKVRQTLKCRLTRAIFFSCSKSLMSLVMSMEPRLWKTGK